VFYCNQERSYLNFSDLPFVVTNLDESNDSVQLNNIKSLSWQCYFDPNYLYYHEPNGRLYYLFRDQQLISFNEKKDKYDKVKINSFNRLPCKIALVKSSLSEKIMKFATTSNESKQVNFEYKSKKFTLNTNNFFDSLNELKKYSQLFSKSDDKI
jgi:hypothetical protein